MVIAKKVNSGKSKPIVEHWHDNPEPSLIEINDATIRKVQRSSQMGVGDKRSRKTLS